MAPSNIVVLLDICLIICGTNLFIFFTSCVQHALPLPGFILLSKDIYSHIFAFNSSGEYDCAIFILCAKAKCYLPVGAKKKLWLQPHSPQSQSDMQTKVLLPACSYSLTWPFRNKANTLTTNYSTLQSNLIWSYWCYDACMDKPTLIPKSNPVPPLELCF